MEMVFLSSFLAGFGPRQIRPRLPAPWQARRRASPGRRGLIINASAKPNPRCPAAVGLRARDRAALPRKAADPVPVPKSGAVRFVRFPANLTTL